jgi:hypothetical protein
VLLRQREVTGNLVGLRIQVIHKLNIRAGEAHRWSPEMAAERERLHVSALRYCREQRDIEVCRKSFDFAQEPSADFPPWVHCGRQDAEH